MNVVDQCHNHYGPLSPNNRANVVKLLQKPDEDVWFVARRVIISPMPLITLEMAVFQVTKRTPESCPDPFTLYRAIRHAISRRVRFQQNPIPLDIET